MKNLKRMKIIETIKISQAEFESQVKGFKSGGAYIPASRQFVGRKVKVIVLPEA